MRRRDTHPFWRRLLYGDRRLGAEIRYCASRGIPHSTFLTWAEEDQDKALAWQEAEDAKCGTCGLDPDEYVNQIYVAAVDDYRKESMFQGDVYFCPHCAERDRTLEAMRQSKRVPAGYRVSLFPRKTEAEAADGR